MHFLSEYDMQVLECWTTPEEACQFAI